MKIHTIKRKQILSIDIQTAWNFFSAPSNLNKITPPDLRFKIISDLPETIYEGQIIIYKVKILPLIYRTWVTEIRHMQFMKSFVDEQRFGPYKFWYHRHSFTEHGSSVEMEDEVHYAVGFGLIGEMINVIFIRKKLQMIFDYRFSVLEEKFNKR